MASWSAEDGTAIYYEIHGAAENEAVLLLPGLLGAVSNQWRSFLEPLAVDFRILLVDLHGHGRSQNHESGLLPERMVADIVGLLDHLAVEQVHVAGYSLGGYLGLMLALNEPRRIMTLLMHATKFYWTHEAVADMRRQLDPDRMEEKVPTYAAQLVQAHGSRWRMLVRQAADLAAYLAEQGLTEGMARRANLPALVSVGALDELVPLPEAVRLSRLLPQGGLLVLPWVRHPWSTLHPVPFLPAMQAFHQRRWDLIRS